MSTKNVAISPAECKDIIGNNDKIEPPSEQDNMDCIIANVFNKNPYNRAHAAFNLKLPIEYLFWLCYDENEHVRETVAKNPNSNQHILSILAQDNNRVQNAVSRHEKITAEIVRILLANKNNIYYLVQNYALHFMQPSVINDIYNVAEKSFGFARYNIWEEYNNFIDIACFIANMHNTPTDILLKLACHSSSKIKVNVASNPNITKEIIDSLASETDVNILRALVENPTTPIHIVEYLSLNYNHYVSDAAKEKIISKNWHKIRQ